MIGQAIRDLRHASRMILRMPALAAVVIVSLGVGIGANTIVFSWIQAVVFSPIPGVRAASRFHLVEPRTETGMYPGSSWLEYRDLRERLHALDGLIAFRMIPLYVGERGRVERSSGLLVSDNYFTSLGLTPALGRFLRADEVEKPGSAPVVVISYDYWQTRFGGAPGALGQNVRVNGADVTIIGVTPRGFKGTVMRLTFDFWLPATMAPVVLNGSRDLEDRGARGYTVTGTLGPGASRAQAQSDVDVAMRQLAQAYPQTNRTMVGDVLPYWRSPRGPQRLMAASLGVLQLVMLLLLLAVCGNTANLVLARASARHREMGVRLALGAGPWRVASLLLTENVLLALLGAALGGAIGIWGTTTFERLAAPARPRHSHFVRDERGRGDARLHHAPRTRVRPHLRTGARPPARADRHAARLARRRQHPAAQPPAQHADGHRSRAGGRRPPRGRPLPAQLHGDAPRGSRLQARRRPAGRFRSVRAQHRRRVDPRVCGDAARAPAGVARDRIRRPRVRGAARHPRGCRRGSSRSRGRARSDDALDEALTNTVTPGYFAVMGLPLRAGRDFADLRDAAAPPQVIVNEEFVRRYLAGADPLGRWVETRGRKFTITGVVKNSLYNAFGEPPTPILYFSFRDRPSAFGDIHVRTRAGSETTVASDIRRVVRDIDPELPVYDIRTLSDHIEANLIFRRIPARMFAVLGPLLLLLAAIGIYAVVAYAVTLRTTEIGVRLALGATVRRLIAQCVGEHLLVIGTGALAGWLIACAVVVGILSAPLDLPVFVGVPAILLVVATLGSWWPARRITRVDPMLALRAGVTRSSTFELCPPSPLLAVEGGPR